VVHNSHAASFALIAYATSWMRKHYLAEFTCSLLNAQPMGFYSPSTIVGDSQRHGLAILPIDVTRSAWDCTLEPADDEFGFAVRMGLRWVKGLQLADGARIVGARDGRPFDSVEDVVRRRGSRRGGTGRRRRRARSASWVGPRMIGAMRCGRSPAGSRGRAIRWRSMRMPRGRRRSTSCPSSTRSSGTSPRARTRRAGIRSGRCVRSSVRRAGRMHARSRAGAMAAASTTWAS